jgi:HK97 gp10 family phage protein
MSVPASVLATQLACIHASKSVAVAVNRLLETWMRRCVPICGSVFSVLSADAANAIEADMKSSTSERIGSTIRTRRSRGGLRVEITAGDRQRAIHAGFAEYGTVTEPARPFATPAAETARPGFDRAMRHLLEGS